MISSVTNNCLPGSVCPQHTQINSRNHLCYYRSSHTILITHLFAGYHTHLLRPKCLCYFGSSQTIHLTELYAVYRTHLYLASRFCSSSSSQMGHQSELYAIYHTQLHLASRFCSSASSPTVFMNQLYATYRTRTCFLNRIWRIRHRSQFISLVTILFPCRLRFMLRTQFSRLVSDTCVALGPSCSSECQIHVPSTMRSCNSWTPEECFVCIKCHFVTGWS
jgi:hypothetical protein